MNLMSPQKTDTNLPPPMSATLIDTASRSLDDGTVKTFYLYNLTNVFGSKDQIQDVKETGDLTSLPMLDAVVEYCYAQGQEPVRIENRSEDRLFRRFNSLDHMGYQDVALIGRTEAENLPFHWLTREGEQQARAGAGGNDTDGTNPFSTWDGQPMTEGGYVGWNGEYPLNGTTHEGGAFRLCVTHTGVGWRNERCDSNHLLLQTRFILCQEDYRHITDEPPATNVSRGGDGTPSADDDSSNLWILAIIIPLALLSVIGVVAAVVLMRKRAASGDAQTKPLSDDVLELEDRPTPAAGNHTAGADGGPPMFATSAPADANSDL